MRGVIGLDVGGVNTKAVWRAAGGAVRSVLRPYDVVDDREALTAVVRDVVAELAEEPPALVALTMTAELSDAFRTKREGVAFVLDVVEAAIAGPVLVVTTAGELVSLAEARARPLDVAAANWVASALAVGTLHADALMLDVGSTTADVIPIAAGRVAAEGRTDLDRLLAGELVYTGALRTNLAAIAPRVPVRGRWCPVASELFAISADVHLILGHLAPAAYTCPTPDGRAASLEGARGRVARLVCADAEQLEPGDVEAIAAFLHAEQVRRIEAAARQVSTRVAGVATPVVPLGVGAFLARAVAERLGRPALELPWSAAERDAAPAAALAELAAGRLGRSVLTVVKVGGGLAREAGGDALRALCAEIGAAGARHPLLVVPGGAAFADTVREHDDRFGLRPQTAHRMAILAMDQFGWALSELIPGAERRATLAPPTAGVVSVLLPAALLAERDPLPASWAVTSDSIAAWVAGAAGAERLVLVKPVAGLYRSRPPAGEPIARLTVDALAALAPAGVDEHLPAALRAAGVETWVIGGGEPARLAELLDTGRTAGTLVTARG